MNSLNKNNKHYFLPAIRVTIFFALLASILVQSCAKIIHPEGGPKDAVNPILTRSLPLHGSTKFNGKKIELTFNKEIDVKNIYSQLFITPSLEKTEDSRGYTYKVRGKTLTITLDQPLREETTYTFNFGDSVMDITESNLALNLVVTFSTGDEIDEMYVQGQVRHLMTDAPAAKSFAMLYSIGDTDRNITNSPPDYFAKTDDEGNFIIDYIKPGLYRICAGSKIDNKMQVDSSADEYGFLKTPIDLTEMPSTEREPVLVHIVKSNVKEFKMQRAHSKSIDTFEVDFSKPVMDYTIVSTKTDGGYVPELYSNLSTDKRSIIIYNTPDLVIEDFLPATIGAVDEIGNVVEADVEISFKQGKKSEKPTSVCGFSPASGVEVPIDFVGKIHSSKPIIQIDPDQFVFINGEEVETLDPENISFNSHRDIVTIKKHLGPNMITPAPKKEETDKAKEGLDLRIDAGAIVCIDGGTNVQILNKYKVKKPKEYGIIKGTVNTYTNGFIVQLLDLNYKVIDEVKNEKNYQFNLVAPGDYRLRLLGLKDEESSWRPGNILENREPDPVYIYPYVVSVVANWEIKDIDFD